MSDDDFGFYKFRGLLIFGVIFAALFIYSLFDIVFLVFGREGVGVVTDAYVNTSRCGPDTVTVEFKFTDPAGKERIGKVNIGDAAKPPPGTEFEIQYLPSWLLTSPDAARPKRPFGWITLSLFAGGRRLWILYLAGHLSARRGPYGASLATAVNQAGVCRLTSNRS